MAHTPWDILKYLHLNWSYKVHGKPMVQKDSLVVNLRLPFDMSIKGPWALSIPTLKEKGGAEMAPQWSHFHVHRMAPFILLGTVLVPLC